MNLTTLYKKLTNGKHTFGNKLIISLFVGFFGLLNFCNAETSYTYTGSYNSNKDDKRLVAIFPAPYINPNPNSLRFNCSFSNVEGDSTIPMTIRVLYERDTGELSNTTAGSSFTLGGIDQGMTSYYRVITLGLYFNSTPGTLSFDYSCSFFSWGSDVGNYVPRCPTCPTCQVCQECQECPEVNTGEILSGYILESEIDTNYCIGNGLCPNECGSGEEMTGTNRSSLFINNIQYPGAPTIKFTIPEEIQREQNTDEEETNIDVIGYGYDQDKMQQMVNTQYYKPTAEEMSGLMEKVADFLPLVAVALLIIRIRRIVKKVF